MKASINNLHTDLTALIVSLTAALSLGMDIAFPPPGSSPIGISQGLGFVRYVNFLFPSVSIFHKFL